MNFITFFILVFSFLASTMPSVLLMKRNKKKKARLIALGVNTFILSTASVVLYKLDVQTFHKETEGLFESLGIGIFIFFIPILTTINFWIVELAPNSKTSPTTSL